VGRKGVESSSEVAPCGGCIYGMFRALCREIERVVSNATINISKLSTRASICILIRCRNWVGKVSNLRSKLFHALVVYMACLELCVEKSKELYPMPPYTFQSSPLELQFTSSFAVVSG